MSAFDLASVRSFAHAHHRETLDLLRTIARIPAPSHHEDKRAAFIHAWMLDNGLTDAFVDAAKNVICPIGDDGSCDLIVFAAHTDVVFDDTDELPLEERGGRLFAPGVGDDTANLAALLIAGRELACNQKLLPPGCGALIVANSCEEGLGNLAGTRELFAAYGSRIRRFYSFDLYLGFFTSTAVGSHRWKITVRTQGGHSFHDFGKPSAIERLCALVGELYTLKLPTHVPATVNVGSIEGGTTINSIASSASATFEYRSTSDAVLQQLKQQLQEVVSSYERPDVTVELESLGERPASIEERSEALERMCAASSEVIGKVTGEEPHPEPASTDANIPLSLGVPANTIGSVRGGLAHTRDEWIDAASVEDGLAVVMGIMQVQRDL